MLGLLPKFGAIISAIPVGVLGGAVTVLFGMIAVLGARIWIEAGVELPRPRQPGDGGRGADRRHRELHAHLGRLLVRAASRSARIAAIVIYQVLRLFQPELPEPGTAIGDSLSPLATAPDPRRPSTTP